VPKYTDCETNPTDEKPAAPITSLGLPLMLETGVVRHAFAVSGSKTKPVHLTVNGRKGRRAVCVLYGDGMRYDVLDLDAAMENEELDEELESEEEEEVEV
jgi:anaphase-promoting complex subunit 4